DALVEEGHQQARDKGDVWAVGFAVFRLSQSALMRGDYGRARTLLHDSEAPLRELGDKRHLAFVVMSLGQVAQAMGDFDAALSHFREGLGLARGVRDALAIMWSLEGITAALAANGHARTAARLLGAIETQRARVSAAKEPVPGWTEE